MHNRRHLLRATAALTLVGAGALSPAPALAGGADSRTSKSPRITLPAPGGPHPVGAIALRLVDQGRADPWRSGQPYRELMVSVRYPAAGTFGRPAARQLAPGEAAGFAAFNNLSDVPGDAADWAATSTHAHERAPVVRGGRALPVILYSPGLGDPRGLGTTLYDDLASRGFVTVAVDHTYDSTAVQFPGGRVEETVLPEIVAEVADDPAAVRATMRRIVAVRVADLRFVLDALPRRLPPALRALADFTRAGVYGHSAGGFAALQALHEDARFRAGADLDGVLAHVQEDSEPGHLSQVARDGLDRPFLILGKDGNDAGSVPSWAALSRHSTATRHWVLSMPGAAHATFSDVEVMVPQLGLPREVTEENVGTADVREAVHRQRELIRGFFCRALA